MLHEGSALVFRLLRCCNRSISTNVGSPVTKCSWSLTSAGGWTKRIQQPRRQRRALEPRWSCLVPGHRWAHTTVALRDDDDCQPHIGHWPYTERKITVTTCADLYKSWRGHRHGYSTAPTTGLPVPVSYVHTGMDRAERQANDANSDEIRRPLVVILTGAPGTYKDFAYLIPYLDQNGVDVVSLVWPGRIPLEICPSAVSPGAGGIPARRRPIWRSTSSHRSESRRRTCW